MSIIMRAAAVGVIPLAIVAGPARSQAHKWELPLVSRQGDTMYTDLAGIQRVAPHVYRAWSKYVYPKPVDNATVALVQKDYDCEQRMRRVVSAVFYDANNTVTWKSKEPGRWMTITFLKGRRQWAAVCRVEEGTLASFISWLKSKLP